MPLILGFTDGHIMPVAPSSALCPVQSVPVDVLGWGAVCEPVALEPGAQQHEHFMVRQEER